jgi:hypothetical protein
MLKARLADTLSEMVLHVNGPRSGSPILDHFLPHFLKVNFGKLARP